MQWQVETAHVHQVKVDRHKQINVVILLSLPDPHKKIGTYRVYVLIFYKVPLSRIDPCLSDNEPDIKTASCRTDHLTKQDLIPIYHSKFTNL